MKQRAGISMVDSEGKNKKTHKSGSARMDNSVRPENPQYDYVPLAGWLAQHL